MSSPAPSPRPDGDRPPKLHVSGVQVAASAAASVTAAVIASLFGVTGTIIGTAVVSVVATAGTAVYNASLRRTQHRFRQARTRREAAGGLGSPSLGGPVGAPDAAMGLGGVSGPRSDPTRPLANEPDATARASPPTKLRRVPLIVGVVSVFVAAMGAVTVIELAGRAPLAALVGPSRAQGGTSLFGPGSAPAPVPTTIAPAPTTSLPSTATSTTVAPTTTTSSTTTSSATTTVPTTTTTGQPTSTTVAGPSTATLPAGSATTVKSAPATTVPGHP